MSWAEVTLKNRMAMLIRSEIECSPSNLRGRHMNENGPKEHRSASKGRSSKRAICLAGDGRTAEQLGKICSPAATGLHSGGLGVRRTRLTGNRRSTSNFKTERSPRHLMVSKAAQLANVRGLARAEPKSGIKLRQEEKRLATRIRTRKVAVLFSLPHVL